MKCDACSRLFCKDHLLYDDHTCSGKYKKDIQVPVCPLCSAPIPIARGAVPDLAVSAHIDQGCPAVKHGKQCKKHELVACICSACQTNFCLAHRHPTDHDCKGAQPAASRAAAAVASRAPQQQQQRSSQSKVTDFFTGPFRPTAAGPRAANPSPAAAAALNRQAGRGSTPGRPLMARQVNGMSEDEALAAAMAASLVTSGGEQQGGGAVGGQGLSQEEEDLALARALQESEAMARREGMAGGRQQQGQGVGQGDKNCSLQ